ncbi:AraC family transcriptional regulator [Paenibacillus sp. Marseille-Q4541]|uniref:helix-turn-helix transcriptional regulator n=1 Tax=Paenibacillus sp. Marseille-Q4541 TaxID=2831522 RepID=UPI001BA8EE52|nr:AraC family transcriptional regulator [Paenibacillus sp. Marseille-Q4541]
MSNILETFLGDFPKMGLVINTLTKMDVRIIDPNGTVLVQQISHEFPAVLHNIDQDFSVINSSLEEHLPNHFIYYVNSYGLGYIAVGIWNKQQFYGSIAIGPLLSSIPSKDSMSYIMANNQLPIGQQVLLWNFYESLPVISSMEKEALGYLLVRLSNYEPIQAHEIALQSKRYPSEDRTEIHAESNKSIEERYEGEKIMIDLISKGDKKAIRMIFKEEAPLQLFLNRFPGQPIRAVKNSLLVLNTLCRISAEKGSVHPLFIHHISGKFSILIEKISSLQQSNSLLIQMINEYCEMIHTYSTRSYSFIVKKAVDYIQLFLDHPLTLEEIADVIKVNPTLLSRKFKEETNMNVIEYIHSMRVENAKLFLSRGKYSITEVAFMVGFNDANYFTRVFKKITSLTPSQYIKKCVKNSVQHT